MPFRSGFFRAGSGARGAAAAKQAGRDIFRRAAVDESLCRKSSGAATRRRSRNDQGASGSVLRNRMALALVFRRSNRTRNVARLYVDHFAARPGCRKATRRRSARHCRRRSHRLRKTFRLSRKNCERPRPYRIERRIRRSRCRRGNFSGGSMRGAGFSGNHGNSGRPGKRAHRSAAAGKPAHPF